MAVTLNDYLKQAKSPLAKGFIQDLLRASDLMKIVPFKPVEGLQVSGTRWQTLSSAAFRKLNSGYTESTGVVEQIEESMFQLGGDVKIEKVLTKAGNTVQDPLRTQMQMKATAVAFTFSDYFINGDHASDPDGFEGVKKRVAGMPSRQTIDVSSLPVLASANVQTFIDYLHQAIKYCNGASHILCNETAWLGLGQVLRRAGLLETTTDAYGKIWSSFQGIPFVDVGLKSDKSTEIITTSTSTTDLYVVALNTGDGLHGIQLSGSSPEPYDPLGGAEMETGPQYLRRIDWTVGLFNLSQYSIVKLANVKFAAS